MNIAGININSRGGYFGSYTVWDPNLEFTLENKGPRLHWARSQKFLKILEEYPPPPEEPLPYLSIGSITGGGFEDGPSLIVLPATRCG